MAKILMNLGNRVIGLRVIGSSEENRRGLFIMTSEARDIIGYGFDGIPVPQLSGRPPVYFRSVGSLSRLFSKDFPNSQYLSGRAGFGTGSEPMFQINYLQWLSQTSSAILTL